MKKKTYLFLIVLTIIGCSEIVEDIDISDKTVQLIAPTDGAVLDEVAITLSWELLEGANSYHLQIATPSFENALQVVKDSSLTGPHFSTTLDTLTYEWRVRAENGTYITPYTTQSFSIEE